MNNERVRASRWSVERGAPRSDGRSPHRLLWDGRHAVVNTSCGKRELIMLNDEEADAFDALLAPAAPSEGDGRRPTVWRDHNETAEWPDSLIVQQAPGPAPAMGLARWQTEWLEKNPEALGVAAATPDTDPLPPGVHRAPTGELLCKGGALLSLPSGWQFRNMSGASWTLCSKFGSPSYNHSFFAVRPVPPVPEPERVHYLEAVGRLVPGEDEPIQVAVGWGVSVRADAAIHVVQADADGLVSVLPLGDPK